MFQRNQLIALVGSSVLKVGVAVGVASVITWFTASRIVTISDSIVRLRTLAAISERRATSTAALRSALKEVEATSTAARAPLIQPENILEFVSVLESIASQTSMTQKVRFGVPVPYSGPGAQLPVASVDFTIELAGTQATMLRYLSLLESARYYAAVHSISLNASTPQGLNGASTIVLTGTLYVSQE